MTGNYEKMYEVIPAKPGAQRKTYKLGGRDYSFNGHNAFYVKDKAAAKDLATLHGGEKNSYSDELRVIPTENNRIDPTGVHNYNFTLQHLGDWKSKIDWSR